GPEEPRGAGHAAPWPRPGRRAAVGAPGVAGEGARRGQGVGVVAAGIAGPSAAIDPRSLRTALRPRTCLGVSARRALWTWACAHRGDRSAQGAAVVQLSATRLFPVVPNGAVFPTLRETGRCSRAQESMRGSCYS